MEPDQALGTARKHNDCILPGTSAVAPAHHHPGSSLSPDTGCVRLRDAMSMFHHLLLRIKSRLVLLLTAVFLANIFAASAGMAAPFDWIEHEKSHLASVDGHAPESGSNQPAEKHKHDCHASHFFQAHVAQDLTKPQPASACILSVSYLSPALRDMADLPFRPPR